MPKKRILCFTSYFLPGFRSGGPVRSLTNLCASLRDEFEFYVITRNRDLGAELPYTDVECGRWNRIGGVQVWYLNSPYAAVGPIREAILTAAPDLIYFQSALDPAVTVFPLLLRRLNLVSPNIPVLVAPRGELFPGALAQKRGKKALFRLVARKVGLYSGVGWHATDPLEAGYLRDWFGDHARIFFAPNLPPLVVGREAPRRLPKIQGSLRLVWLSRISPKKNLAGAIGMLARVNVQVTLAIFGTLEDKAHWAECQRLIVKLPPNVRVDYRGVIAPEDVVQTLAGYDAFYFPTLGENFGHVILEALLAGCPLLLSDRTPWRSLAQSSLGFDLPLEQPDAFVAAIERLAAMSPAEFEVWSSAARNRGLAYCDEPGLREPTRVMLEQAIAGH